jgi:hypothetical protein
MPGRGRVPKPSGARHGHHSLTRGEWQPAPATGWQHGAIPRPPTGLLPSSRDAWNAWFGAWWAAHWSPDDVPGIRIVVRLFDEVERGNYQRAGEWRQWADTYGITPKGAMERRWLPAAARPNETEPPPARYGHIHALNPEGAIDA